MRRGGGKKVRFRNPTRLANPAADGQTIRVHAGSLRATPVFYDGLSIINGVTTNPTKGTKVEDRLAIIRMGSYALVSLVYKQSAAGSAGSGTYLFNLNGLTIDTTRVTASTTGRSGNVGQGRINAASADNDIAFPAYVFVYDTGNLALKYQNNSGTTLLTSIAGPIGSGVGALSNAFVWYYFNAVVPILEWSAP